MSTKLKSTKTTPKKRKAEAQAEKQPKKKATTVAETLSSINAKKRITNALKWPSEKTKQKFILNAAVDRSVWEFSANSLNFLTFLEKKYGNTWTDVEKKQFANIMKHSGYIFRPSGHSDHGYEPPHILDGILEEDPRIISTLEFGASEAADYNAIFQ